MSEPRWRDVDLKTGICSHCGGTHHGTGLECPYREENMGQPCTGCGERTCYCCSDCGIDGAGKVYVCTKDACRLTHEKKHKGMRGQRGADPKCVDLARHFLPSTASDDFIYRLGLHIQEQVEDWMECYEEANPPVQPAST